MNRHIVQNGESLWQIANIHNISLQDLIKANPQIQDPNTVSAGQTVFIPSDDWKIPEPPAVNSRQNANSAQTENQTDSSSNDNRTVEGENTDLENAELCKKLAALPRPLIYIVKKGDTLFKISKCFNISLRELLQVNSHIQNPDSIVPGDKVFIPRSAPEKPPLMPAPTPNPGVCPYCGRPLPPR